MMRHFFNALRGDPTPPENVRKEGPDVVWALGTAKCNEEDGVERLRHTWIMLCLEAYGIRHHRQRARLIHKARLT